MPVPVADVLGGDVDAAAGFSGDDSVHDSVCD